MLGDNMPDHKIAFSGSWCPGHQDPPERVDDIDPGLTLFAF